MTPVTWRRAVPTDARALSLLGGATFLESFAFDHDGTALIDHVETAHAVSFYDRALADPGQSLIIGETPLGCPVGYAIVLHKAKAAMAVAGDAELLRIYLLAGWQGGGHGDAVLAEAEAAARAIDAPRMLLAVYPDNVKARRFYARHGYAEIGEQVFQLGDIPMRDLVYAKAL